MTRRLRLCTVFVSALLSVACSQGSESAGSETKVAFQQRQGSLEISIGDQAIANYVWMDEQTKRPYFRHLRTRSGVQVTRNHPPIAGQDVDDHPTMHPGLWLAFGDLNGSDFWRNKGHVRHVEFLQQTEVREGVGTFTVKNSYETDGRVIGTEICRISVTPRDNGYLLGWDSTFRSEQGPLTFGDQEEMGIGLRVATPLAVVKGGLITDSEGRKNGAQVWGKQADWCAYGGVLNGEQVGIVLMPDPRNFRRSWFHARDYGLLVANPFGQNAFTKGEPSKVVVPAGKDMELRFNVFVYNGKPDQQLNLEEVYRATVKQAPGKP